jgi:cbb3-type cytochrome oxidase subunit 3
MLRELLATIPPSLLPVTAMLLFLAFFAAVLVRVLRRGRAAYQQVASLPLHDSENRRAEP